MDNRLILIDGYPLIYRAYYAFMHSAKLNSKGVNTSIILGFVNTLDMILRDYSPSYVAVVFDSASKTFRHEAYPEYKAQREATPEDIHAAVPLVKKIVEAFNIAQLSMDGYEADDIIGTLAKKAGAEGYEVLLVTPDKDYAQLVDNNITMLRLTQGNGIEKLGVKEVCEKWQVSSPLQIIDLLALMGDAADNVPGCKGVGEKTAVKLLQEYGSVESLIENAGKLKGAMKTKVQESAEMIKFSKFLVTICLEVPVKETMEDLRIREKNSAELVNIFSELEMKSLVSKFGKKNVSPQLSMFDEIPTNNQTENKYAILSELKTTPHTYQLIETQEDIDDFLPKILCRDLVCFDTETTSTDIFSASLVGMSFSWAKNEAYFVLLPEKSDECVAVLEKFRPFFENENISKVGQNMKFDILMLRHYGVEVKGKLFDTMIAHYLIQPELRHGMDALAETYLQYKTITYEELTDTRNGRSHDLRRIDKNVLCDYASEDADITLQLYNVFVKEIEEKNLTSLFYDMEMPLMHVLMEMEWNGVTIDSETLRKSSHFLTSQLSSLTEEIYKLAGGQFNIASPRQVGELLYEKLKVVDKAKKTKTGQYSTSEDVLLTLKSKHPIVEKILDYRGLKKLLSTYIDSLPQLINPRTGKIHASFNQTITATGRLSSSNPNLQNIPVRDEYGKEIRRCFVPEEGSKFLSADYSQIELRVMAEASGDEAMIEAFNSGFDFHTETASKIFAIPSSEVTKDQRRKAKTANFGILYGISVFGLSERLEIPRDEAKVIIEQYFNAFPRVKSYLEEIKDFAHKNGYVGTLFGRRRYIQDINSRNGTVRAMAERNAINAPIQGTAADIIKVAMINIQRRIEEKGLKSRLIIQVHDELNFTVPNDEAEVMKELVISEMQNAYKMRVPLLVDCIVADNWLDAH